MTEQKNTIPEEMIILPEERDFYERFGRRLRDVRVARGISLEQIAAVADITPEQLEKYENAELAMPIYHLIPILKYMDYPTEMDSIK